MKCPYCQAEGKTSIIHGGMGSSTLIYSAPYWDTDGVYHYHDPNTHTSEYSCSEGHRWIVTTHGGGCAAGDYPEERTEHALHDQDYNEQTRDEDDQRRQDRADEGEGKP